MSEQDDITRGEASTVSAGKLRILGLSFIAAVVAVVAYSHQLVIPIFLGLFTWGKVWFKSLSPKLLLLLAKNSVVIQLRRLAVQASAHFFVKSHKPWRRMLMRLRVGLIESFKNVFAAYLALPLWLRTAIAVGVLVATAGSSFAVFALLIIPQALLEWLRKRIGVLLNKLGVNRFFSLVWNLLVPESLRFRWHMYVKWTLGRRQVNMAKRLHERVAVERSS
ncbi:MAG: hypothetical protein AAF671_02485 [Pseudomonadota bacterium]